RAAPRRPPAPAAPPTATPPAAEDTPREVRRPRDDAGTEVAVSSDQLARELIILYGAQHYLLRATGDYTRPLTAYELQYCWFDALAWAEEAGLLAREKVVAGAAGTPQTVRKKLPEILTAHATLALGGAAASLVAQRSYYDPQTETFTEALCPRRPLAPAF